MFLLIFALIVIEMATIIIALSLDEWVKQGETKIYEWVGNINKVIKVDSDYILPEAVNDWEGDTYESISTTDE
jgi:hypothetical protein